MFHEWSKAHTDFCKNNPDRSKISVVFEMLYLVFFKRYHLHKGLVLHPDTWRMVQAGTIRVENGQFFMGESHD